jgi:hypothetical protein
MQEKLEKLCFFVSESATIAQHNGANSKFFAKKLSSLAIIYNFLPTA